MPRREPAGYWAQSGEHRALWALHASVAKSAVARQLRPTRTWQQRLLSAYRDPFKRVDWAAWARRNLHQVEKRAPLPAAWDRSSGGRVVGALGGDSYVIRKALDSDDIELDLPDALSWRAIQELVRQLQRQAGKAGFDAAAGDIDVRLRFDPDVFDAAIRSTFGDIAGINSNARDALQGLMRDVMQRADTFEEFARVLRDEWEGMSSFRSNMIAVTEWNRAASTATQLAYEQAGITGKIWITVGDDDVDDICAANEAEGPIPIGETFTSGDMHPPAHPLCRCNVSASVAP